MDRIIEFVGNHPYMIALWIALAALLLWNLLADSIGGARSLSPAEATRLMNHEDALLLDLRGKSDYDKGHILNARHMPSAELDEQLGKLKADKSQPVVLCCANGLESQRAARKVQQAGFERVYLIKGGIGGWREASLPLTRE